MGIGNKQKKENNMKKTKKVALLFFFFIFSIVLNAQVYPVQVTTQILPPNNVTLSSHTTTTVNKIKLTLRLNDINKSNLQVRLKMRIKGRGLDIQSRDYGIGTMPIFLNGGVGKVLNSIDLRPYFRLQNLVGISPQRYHKPLPDGVYTLCFDVYTANTPIPQLVSNPMSSCATMYLIVNDPPILNKPERGDQIILKDPLNILFQWQSRSISASNITYQFELRELWDMQIDPQAGFLASPPLFTETTRTNALLYDISKTALLPDKTYAWRVKAISTTGLEENAIFKNNGYSEIFHFRLSKDCDAPKQTLSEALSQQLVKIHWQGNYEHNKYHVQYRKVSYTIETEKQQKRRQKKNKKRAKRGKKAKEYTPKKVDYEWFEVYTQNEQAQIANLEGGQTYEFRVGGTCSSLAAYTQYYTYSRVNEFTMPTKDETVSYNCGVHPEISISNQNPLQNIGINETFTAGDFPVTVKEIQGSNGKFSGKGFIVVPYLADTKIAVVFEGISINTDYQLIDGVVKTTYDPTWGAVESVDEFVQDLIAQIGELFKKREEELNELKTIIEEGGDPTLKLESINSMLNDINDGVDALINSPVATEAQKEELEALKISQYYADTSSDVEKEIANQQEIAKRVEAIKEDIIQAENVKFIEDAQSILGNPDLSIEFWETVKLLEEIYDALELCNNTDWKSYEDKGMIPYCYWKNNDIEIKDFFTGKDTPYVAGIFDGAYQEVEGVLMLPEMAVKFGKGFQHLFYSYTTAYITCRGGKVKANKDRFEELLKKLKVEEEKEGIWSWLKEKWYSDEKEEVNNYLINCDDVVKTRQQIVDLFNFLTEWKNIVESYIKISAKIKELVTLYETTSTVNETRYKKGILDFQILSTFTGVGAVSKIPKVKKVLKTLSNFTKNQWDELAVKYGDEVAKVGADLLATRTSWLNNLKTQYSFDASFLPQGIDPPSISITLKNEIKNGLPQSLPTNIKENIFNTLIQSSSTAPVKKVLNQGDELYKIVPKGNGYSQSSFYISKTEFNSLKNNIDIEQKLGLPLNNHAIEYDVYRATANQSVNIFESTVAPTVQGSFSTSGGAVQTFLLDDTKWTITLEITTLIPLK